MSTVSDRGKLLTINSLNEKSYVKIKEAGDILGVSLDLLIHQGAKGKLRLAVPAPSDMYVWSKNLVNGETDIEFDYPELLILSRRDCLNIDLHGGVTIDSFAVGYCVQNDPISILTPQSSLDVKERHSWSYVLVPKGGDGSESQEIYVRADDLFVLSDEVKSLRSLSQPQPEQRIEPLTFGNRSDSLVILNQAAQKWWGNAKREDRSTHPKKADVVSWLLDRNFSGITAECGATIIAPEWAKSGRKPKE